MPTTACAPASESSAAGRGLLGGTGSLLAWAAIWLFEAVIWLFPFNRTANSITDQLTDTANGEPGWYAHFLTSTGHAFAGTGIWMAAILATVSVIIGLGPLVSRRSGIYIGIGIALALLYWITGEGLGELLTFGGTDPNNGPIIALIGLSVLPLVPEPADEPTPASRFLAANPLGALGARAGRDPDPVRRGVVPSSSSAAASVVLLVVDVGHEHERIVLLHEGDVDDAVRQIVEDRRRRQFDEHVRHGRPRCHGPELEVHRPTPAGRRGRAVDHGLGHDGRGSQDANARL